LKKIFFLLFGIIISTQTLKAQTNYIPLGTWMYINGNDTIEIYLKSTQINVADTSYPTLIGFHKYVKNGQLIESSLNFGNTNFADKKYSIIIYNVKSADIRNDGDFKDMSFNINRLIILTKLNPTTMDVRITSQQTRKNTSSSDYTLPRNFQLVKQ